MPLPVVNTCCCGCTLKTGSLIIGWVEVVFSVLGIIGVISALVTGSGSKSHDGTEMSVGSGVIGILIFVFHLIIAMMLIIGANRSLPKYVNIWVVVAMVGVIIYGISTAIQSIMFLVAGAIGAGLSGLVIGAIVILVQMYFIIVVSSFRKEIAGENRDPMAK